MCHEDAAACHMENAKNRVPNLVLSNSGQGIINILLTRRTMPFDNMNDFIDVHDTSSTRRDEEER